MGRIIWLRRFPASGRRRRDGSLLLECRRGGRSGTIIVWPDCTSGKTEKRQKEEGSCATAQTARGVPATLVRFALSRLFSRLIQRKGLHFFCSPARCGAAAPPC